MAKGFVDGARAKGGGLDDVRATQISLDARFPGWSPLRAGQVLRIGIALPALDPACQLKGGALAGATTGSSLRRPRPPHARRPDRRRRRNCTPYSASRKRTRKPQPTIKDQAGHRADWAESARGTAARALRFPRSYARSLALSSCRRRCGMSPTKNTRLGTAKAASRACVEAIPALRPVACAPC